MVNRFLPYTPSTGGNDWWAQLRRLASQAPRQGAWGQGGGSNWGQGFGPAPADNTRRSMSQTGGSSGGSIGAARPGLPLTPGDAAPPLPPGYQQARGYTVDEQPFSGKPGQDGGQAPGYSTQPVPNPPPGGGWTSPPHNPSQPPGGGWSSSPPQTGPSLPGTGPYQPMPMPGPGGGGYQPMPIPGPGGGGYQPMPLPAPGGSIPPTTTPPGTPWSAQPVPNPPPTSGGGWRNLPDADKAYYEQNPQSFWRQAVSYFARPGSAEEAYLLSQFNTQMALYDQASESNPSMMWVDYVSPGIFQQMLNQFNNQGAAARGANRPAWSPRVAW